MEILTHFCTDVKGRIVFGFRGIVGRFFRKIHAARIQWHPHRPALGDFVGEYRKIT
jgi:hypothetical protein